MPVENFVEVPISSIIFSDDQRQRKEMEDAKVSGQTIDELAASIKDVGLINPIVVNRDNTLVAGRRRIEAFKRLGRDTIIVQYFDTLSKLQRKQIEFDENHKRKNLTWQEEAAAVKELHEMFIAEQKEKRDDVTGTSLPEWSLRDTASELGLSIGKVSEDLTLAENLGNLRIAGRPSRRGAITTARRERELELTRELAKRRSSTTGLEETQNSRQFPGGIVYNEDCRETLSRMAPDSVDLIFTDPPWGINLDSSSQWATKWVASYDDSTEGVKPVLLDAFPLLYKVLKPTCHFYCFFPIQEIQWWVDQLTKVGFYVRQRPLIWFKTGQPSITDPYMGFLSVYEAVLWGFKPGEGLIRRLLAQATSEGFGFPRSSNIWHENQKPTEFIDPYLEASSAVNEIVLDPFAGGGSTLAACSGAGRYFIGVEKDEINYGKIIRRLESLESPEEDENGPQASN